jgi:parvulin-like peptidyl-prolyl isomerase
MKKKWVLVFIGLCWLHCSKTQSPESYQTLASLGDAKVTVEEFQSRFEFSPQIYRYGNATENKLHFLASLLSEKALAQFAREHSLDTLETVSTRAEQFEKEALIEALFDQEISQKVQLSEDEVRLAYSRSKQELALQYFRVDSKNEAEIARHQLAQGEAFDKVAALHLFHDSAKSDSVPVKLLKWGDALPAVEDSVFKLKPFQVCGPVLVDKQFFFFKLVNKKSEVLLTENDFSAERSAIEKKIRRRQRGQLFNQFISRLLRDTRATVTAQKFNFLARELEAAMNVPDQSSAQAGVDNSRRLVENDFLNIQSRLGQNLDAAFIEFSDGPCWTIQAFLTKLRVGPYPLNFDSKAQFRSSLRHTIKFVIELEQLAEEAKKRGLNQSPYVQEETRTWEDYLLASAGQQKLLAEKFQPTDENLAAYYQAHPEKYTSPAVVNIQEILVNDLAQAEDLRRQILAGADAAQLARKFSQRKLSAEKGGVSGFFREGSWGVVGRQAFESEMGTWVGPLETDKKQYSLFRVIEKKPAETKIFEAVPSEVARDFYQESLNHWVQEQALAVLKKHPIEINSVLLDSLKLIDLGSGMLVLKQHFPGRSAVPFVLPADAQTAWWEEIYRAYLKNKSSGE